MIKNQTGQPWALYANALSTLVMRSVLSSISLRHLTSRRHCKTWQQPAPAAPRTRAKHGLSGPHRDARHSTTDRSAPLKAGSHVPWRRGVVTRHELLSCGQSAPTAIAWCMRLGEDEAGRLASCLGQGESGRFVVQIDSWARR